MILLLRWIRLLLLIGLTTACGLWLANHPGELQLDLMGYRISTAFWVMLLTVIALAGVGFFTLWLCLRLYYACSLFASRRTLAHQQKGMEALTRTIAALSLRDYSSASTHLKQSSRLLGETLPLNLLLQAHISSKTGDKPVTVAALNAMQSSPETRFLALTSLSSMANRERDISTALRYAKEAYTLRPTNLQTAMHYLGLLVKTHAFAEALALTKAMRGQRVLSKDEYQRVTARALVCQHQRTPDPALLAKAFDLDAGFPPAYGHIVADHQNGNPKRALKLLYRAWKIAPHPELVELLLHYFDDAPATQQMKRASRLVQYHPQHLESHLAIAQVSMAAKQWELARNHLKAALSLAPQMRVFRLLATLEEQGFHDDIAASLWLKRLQHADPDPTWHCGECGHSSRHWQAHCEACDAFDRSVWGVHPSVLTASHHAEDVLSISTQA
jgi:HemY protein